MRRGSAVFNGRTFIWVTALALLALGLTTIAAPVFAQNSVVNQNADQVGLVNDSICSQVYNTAAQQYNAGDQNADAGAGANANAVVTGQYGEANAAAIAGADATNIANATGIDIGTVNACLNGALPKGETPKGETPKDETPTDEEADTLTPEEEKALKADVILPDGFDQKVLADTGGIPLAGLAVIGLGLVAAGVSLFRFTGRD